MTWSKELRYNLLLLLLCVLFVFLYGFNVWSLWLPNMANFGHIVFNWPDANANYFFASLFAGTNSFSLLEPLNLASGNILHTRSINVYEGHLVPVTFLPGIYFFALFFKLLGSTYILWLTPVLASASVFLAYRISVHVWQDKHLAFLIALLFLSLSPWLYFANVSMLHTVFFVSLLLLAWYFFALYFKEVGLVYWTLANTFLSFAILVRPTEFVWIIFSALLVFFFNKKKVSFFLLLFAGIIFANFAFMALYLNQLTYGDYLSTGYQNLQTGALPTEIKSGGFDYVGLAKLALAPFGFHPRLILHNFNNYFIQIVWPYVIFAVASLYFLLRKIVRRYNKRRIWLKYFLITSILFVLIFLYYGSWDLADPLVKKYNKISISYIRYFMPLYILILPMAAYGIKRLFFKAYNFLHSSIVYFIIIIVSVVSVHMAFYSPHDGLIKNRENIIEYYMQYGAVSKIAPLDSIIVTDRSDKIFFPKYKVIVPQGDLPLWSRVANLIDDRNVYFYSNKTDDALILSKEKAMAHGMEFSEVYDIYENFRLFKINKIK